MYDVLICGALVLDGTGNHGFYADVAAHGDKIAAIAPLGQIRPDQARMVVDGTNLAVAPAFIDTLSHSLIPMMHSAASDNLKVVQGCGVNVVLEGWGPMTGGLIRDPFRRVSQQEQESETLRPWVERAREEGWTHPRDWLEALVERGVITDVASWIPLASIRERVKGFEPGPLTTEQMDEVRRLVVEGMENGGVGASCALLYPPDVNITFEELVEAAVAAALYGKPLAAHVRSEGSRLEEAVEEMIKIGHEANKRLHKVGKEASIYIFHLKASGPKNWFKMARVIELIEEARASGLNIAASAYPYAASGTGLSAVLPSKLAEGGLVQFYKYLAGLTDRDRVELCQQVEKTANIGPERIMPIGFELPEHRQYVGMSLAQIAEALGMHWVDATRYLIGKERQRIFTIYHGQSEENVKEVLGLSWVDICTDAGGMDPAWPRELQSAIHPRSSGTFPRVLRYAREGLFPLEKAVRKMTGAPAARLGLDRYGLGLLKPGYRANLVIFDPETVRDEATYLQPDLPPVGIPYVMVGGKFVIENGRPTGATPGRALIGG